MSWIKMSERIPAEGQFVLLAIKINGAWVVMSGNWDFKGRKPKNDYSHWMPITPPEDDAL